MRPDRARAAARAACSSTSCTSCPRPRRAAVGDRDAGRRALPRVPDRGRPGARAQPRVEHAAGATRKPITHVVAFGGSRPIMAGPVFAAWLGVPLITLIRGNDFDAAVFSTRRRPILDDALDALARWCCAVSQDKVDKIAALHPGDANALDPQRHRPRRLGRSRRATAAHATAWRAAARRPRCTLGLFGQLKAKKGGVFLLDALLRSGVADRFHLLLAGWMAPDMEAWLAEHELELHARCRSWIATSCCRGTRRATGSRSRPSTTGCRTCWSRPRRSASRWSPSRVDGMADVLDRRRDRVPVRPGRRGRAARGRCSARPGWTRRERERMARGVPGAGRAPSSTASCEIAALRRGARADRAARASRARVILYYALGGGLGHLTRARKVLGDGARPCCSPPRGYARDPRVTGGLPVIPVPRRLGHDRAAFRALAGRRCSPTCDPDELIVDSFPGGILGELCGMELPPRAAVARAPALGRYARAPRRPAPAYDAVHVLEPLGYDPPGPVGAAHAPPRRAGRAAARRAALARRPLRPGARARRAARARARRRTLVISPRPPRRLSRRAAPRPRRAHRHRRGVQRHARDRARTATATPSSRSRATLDDQFARAARGAMIRA